MYAEMTRRQDQIRFGKWLQAWWSKDVKDEHYQAVPYP